MARFQRDEKRTYPFVWLVIGGLFAFSSAWALYAELVTRVPWQVHQDDFFDLELELAKKGKEDAEAAWQAASSSEPLKGQLARVAELQEQQKSGDYATAKARLTELDKQFAEAEQEKTFGGSDLDEGYYYRNLSEYERDAAQVEVRRLFKESYAGDAARAREEPANIYADPPAPPRAADQSDAMFHLQSEIARMTAHRDKALEATKNDHPPELVKALRASAAAEADVIAKLGAEVVPQAKIDASVSRMREIDGPAEPRVVAADARELEKLRDAARQEACEGKDDTRNCISWLKLSPIDRELKQLTVAVSKAQRPKLDAALRLAKAEQRAEPTFDPKDPLKAIIGPFEIQQVVLGWMDFKRDVDIEQVDRCHTCHMGVTSKAYADASIPKRFRSHPRRDWLIDAHSIEKFGCTVCHQGQGRATDDLAHAGWVLEQRHGHERWHFAGDHYWEDPMLPVGKLSRVVIDEHNDALVVKIDKGKETSIQLEHGVYGERYDQGEEQLLATLQEKLQAVVDADKGLAAWRALVRKLDNRIDIGLELRDPAAAAALRSSSPGAGDANAKTPRLTLRFPKFQLATLLGFPGATELESKLRPVFSAPHPATQPIRAETAEAGGTWLSSAEEYRYVAPNGAHGLQVTDEMRNRFVQGLPEIESSCLRCHGQDADLHPRRSSARFVGAKLARQKAEAELAKDPAAYVEAHGSADLPAAAEGPEDVVSLAPTLDQGRWLYRQLNCGGCHLLEGFENNKNAGPQLDDVSAKLSPEWMLRWLRYPRGWRTKTSMPNLWPRPLDPASKLPYVEGSPEYQKWASQRAEETVAVAAFLYERSESPNTRPGASAATALRGKIAGYADVTGADAAMGKKYFEAYGCQGCHTVTEGKELPHPWRNRERDIAPTLSNLGNKLSADWIAYWVENPSRYWHGTSMPSLRLSRIEAASIARYLVSLKSEAPYPAEVSPDEIQLVADPKRRAEVVPCAVAAGQSMSRVDCGAKVIEQRGCYGCHQITGFEKASPIGPELTGYAQKDVTTLDFGYAIADHHLQTTETFAALKLDSPRIFVRDRIELRMGDYDLSADEIRALVIFLKGAVNSAPRTAFDPMQQKSYALAIEGRQLVNDLNCRGCHVIEGRGGEIDGWRRDLLSRDPQQRAPFLNGEGGRVQPEWLFGFLRDPGAHGIRPWLHPDWAYGEAVPQDKLALRMPTFDLTPEQWTAVVRYFATWDEQPYPYQVPKVREIDKQQKLWALSNMNSTQTGNCLSCHYYRDFPVERARGDLAKMAPNLDEVRRRLRPEWVHQWLLRPSNYLPYTKMLANFASVDRPKDAPLWPKENDPFLSPPAVGWERVVPELSKLSAEQQAEVIRDFLYSIPDGAPWPAVGEEPGSVMVDPEAATLRAKAAEEEPAPGEAPGG